MAGAAPQAAKYLVRNGLTAAHRTLLFGTKVLVTNMRNGRTVVVRIIDPGPYGRGRVIDVSRAAAREPDRQVFAKFKHLLRKAAARSAETICVTIGEIRAFTPNAPPISETQAMPNPKSIML